jgi:hypothetical protein
VETERQRRDSATPDDDIELTALTPRGTGPDAVNDFNVAEDGESTGGDSSTIRASTGNTTSDNNGNQRNSAEVLQLTSNSTARPVAEYAAYYDAGNGGYPTEYTAYHYYGNGRYPTEEVQSSAGYEEASHGSALISASGCQQEDCYCQQEETLPRSHIQGDSTFQSWVNTSFLALYEISEYIPVCKNKVIEHIRRKYPEVQSRNAGILAQLESESALRVNVEVQRAEWERQAKNARTERDEWERQAEVAISERNEWEKQARAGKAESDELLSHIATDPGASERLQKMRLKLVFRDLVITVWKKRLDEWVQKEQFKLVSKNTELNHIEVKRQEHNKKIRENFQKESSQTRQNLETETRKLQSARTILITDQAVLAQSQQVYATKNAALHREINTLETAIHAQEASFARKRNALESATKELAARERASKNAEVLANERMLQRRLELVRKEAALAEREKAMPRG